MIFQRDFLSKAFNHFPNLKRMNAFPNVKMNDKKLEKYKSKLQELLDNFQAEFTDLQKLKPCFTFLVNPFEADVVTSG